MNSNERKEAFARIEQCCVSACLGLGQSPYNRFMQSITPCREDLEIIKQDLDRLEQLEKENQELREIKTPMKPIRKGKLNWWHCPKCDCSLMFDNHKYCDHCGQKLDWSGKDES